MTAVVQWVSSEGGSPSRATLMTPPFLGVWAIPGAATTSPSTTRTASVRKRVLRLMFHLLCVERQTTCLISHDDGPGPRPALSIQLRHSCRGGPSITRGGAACQYESG